MTACEWALGGCCAGGINSNHRSRSRSPHRTARYALSAVAAVAALGLSLVGCGEKGSGTRDEGKSTTTSTGTQVLWLGDSIAGAEAP
jgi:hypothetical protein